MLDGDEGEFVDCALASRVFRKLNLRDAEDAKAYGRLGLRMLVAEEGARL